MAYTQNTIQLEGFPFGTFTFTYKLSGVDATDDAASRAAGKAVSFDPDTAGAVRPAGDGEPIVGRIYQAENRPAYNGGLVASVARKFKERLLIADGYDPTLLDHVVGGGAGTVKKAADGDVSGPIVIAIDNDFVIVEYL